MPVTDKFARWYQNDIGNRSRIASPGYQYLIQLLKGGVLGAEFIDGAGHAALDVGCGNGYNLVSLSMLGWSACGLEIHPTIAEIVEENLKIYDVDADVVVGRGQELPFVSESYKLLLSINAAHYADTEQQFFVALSEFARVLKHGGKMFAEFIHPESWLLEGALVETENMRIVKHTQDFRLNEKLFVFNSEDEISNYLHPIFKDIKIGIKSAWFGDRQATSYVVIATKP